MSTKCVNLPKDFFVSAGPGTEVLWTVDRDGRLFYETEEKFLKKNNTYPHENLYDGEIP